MAISRKNQRGSTVIEFVLTGLPALFLIISVVELGRGMWNYHTLARAVNAGAHLAAVRGKGCTNTGNSCSVSVGTIASSIQDAGIGLPAGEVNVQLTTSSGASTSCNPLSSCTANTTIWPPATNSDNEPGNNVTVSAQYTFRSAITMLWPGAGEVRFGTFTFPATSTQRILF